MELSLYYEYLEQYPPTFHLHKVWVASVLLNATYRRAIGMCKIYEDPRANINLEPFFQVGYKRNGLYLLVYLQANQYRFRSLF